MNVFEMSGEGSTENLTLTLTEEPPRTDTSPYFDYSKNNGFFMTAEELKALQENADMILNTLREAEISDDEDDEDHCGMSSGDMLDDETMSLVSNESDEEFPSPDGTIPSHTQKHSPMTQTCNGMVGLPSTHYAPSKYSSKKTSLPQMSEKNRFDDLPKEDNFSVKNRYSHLESNFDTKQGQFLNNTSVSESPKKSGLPVKSNQINENTLSKIKPPVSNRKLVEPCANEAYLNQELPKEEDCAFDTRTFTRKKPTVPKGIVPSIQPSSAQVGSLRSPSSQNIPSLPASTTVRTSEPSKTVTSKIAGVWKTGKVRSKSMVDPNRNAKLRLEKSPSIGSGLPKDGANHLERSPSQTPSPQSPLSRSSTYEKLNEDDGSAFQTRRPNSLAISQKTSSPRHVRVPSAPQRPYSSTQRQGSEGIVRPRTMTSKTDVPSPTSHHNLSNIPKFQNKAQPSLIPNRRSMIPTPAKFEFSEN